MKIRVKRLHADAQLPCHNRDGDAAMDIRSVESCVIKAGQKHIVHSGLAFEIPKGYAGLVWDRSGLAAKHDLHTMAGVLDSNYRGELMIVLKNLSDNDFEVSVGDRIAQLLVQPVQEIEVEESDELSDTERGEKRFLSSGLR